jgi:hypothetical protein
MDGVVFYRCGGDRFEGTESDMQGDIGKPDTLRVECGDQFRGEMQTGGWGGDGNLASAVRVHGLVAFEVALALHRIRAAIGSGAVDVRWQGNIAEPVGDLGNGTIVGSRETDQGRAVVIPGDNRAGEGAGRMRESRSDGEATARLDQAAPGELVAIGTKQEALDLASGRPPGVEPGGQDGGIVAEESVTILQIGGQLGKSPMLQGASGAVHHKQARLIAARGGRLRDQVGRQVVVEEFGGEGRHGMITGLGRRWLAFAVAPETLRESGHAGDGERLRRRMRARIWGAVWTRVCTRYHLDLYALDASGRRSFSLHLTEKGDEYQRAA